MGVILTLKIQVLGFRFGDFLASVFAPAPASALVMAVAKDIFLKSELSE
jgi:hypothetical protein